MRHDNTTGSLLRTLRSRLTALVAAATMLAIFATSVSAAPVERRRSTVECLGSTVTLVMHPGEGAIALWDISVEEVQNAPSYLIKSLEAELFVNGESQGTFSGSFGKKTGFGTPLSCTFEVHEDGFDVYGSSELVQL